MRFLLTNLWFLGILSVIVLVAGFVLSVTQDDWNWLGGAGSIWTLIAAVASSRELTRLGYGKWKKAQNIIDCGHIVPTEEEKEENKQEELDRTASVFSTALGILSVPLQIFGYLFEK